MRGGIPAKAGMMEGTTFETSDELREELGLYLLYFDTAPRIRVWGQTLLHAL